MRSKQLICALGTLLIGVSTAAVAQNAFTSRPLNVRAGPDRAYPLVARVGPGTPVNVNGCLNDWSWCDVSFDGNRGWAYAPALNYVYQGQQVPLYSYAPALGIPVVTFSLGTYWNQYYRGRPWYGQRTMWMHRRLPEHRRPPGPAPQNRLPLHAQQFGRPSGPSRLARAPEAAHGGSARHVEGARAGSARPESAESRERGPAERGAVARPPAEHAPAERAPAEHAQTQRGNAGNIRSADRRGERPANERSGNDRSGNARSAARPTEGHPSSERKTEPPQG